MSQTPFLRSLLVCHYMPYHKNLEAVQNHNIKKGKHRPIIFYMYRKQWITYGVA